jgi:dimethylhistidine N-methyltransferase
MNVEIGRRPVASETRCDVASETRCEFADALIVGLSARQKSIPCRFFYDAAGSALFEAITELPEYYPTRTETAILRDHAADMAALAAPGAVLIEFGSGSSTKTELLLAGMPGLYAYMPIDISGTALREARSRIATRFPRLAVLPVEADFSRPLALGDSIAAHPRLGFFPGSTIGNLTEIEAVKLLANMRAILGDGAKLIIGADLKKDVRRLIAAYDDAAGVTAAFNLNLLHRANRELGADFDVEQFAHAATYDVRNGRIDMHLVSRAEQSATVLGHRFRFAVGERIHTEHSHKYDVDGFQAMAKRAGWWPQVVWTDDERLFSVHVLVAG